MDIFPGALFAAATVGVGAAVITVTGYASLSFLTVNLLGALWGAVAFPLYAISVAHANDYAEADDYVMVSSGLLLMYGLGAIIGPFLASVVINLYDASGLFLFTGVVHLSMALFVAYRMLRRESTPEEQHIAFGDALATAHTASQCYEDEIQELAEDRID